MKVVTKKVLKILDLKIVAEKNQIAVMSLAMIQQQKKIHQMPQAKKHPIRAANQILQVARVKAQQVQKQPAHQMMLVQPKQMPLLEKQIQQPIQML